MVNILLGQKAHLRKEVIFSRKHSCLDWDILRVSWRVLLESQSLSVSEEAPAGAVETLPPPRALRLPVGGGFPSVTSRPLLGTCQVDSCFNAPSPACGLRVQTTRGPVSARVPPCDHVSKRRCQAGGGPDCPPPAPPSSVFQGHGCEHSARGCYGQSEAGNRQSDWRLKHVHWCALSLSRRATDFDKHTSS